MSTGQLPLFILYVDDEDMARKYFARTIGPRYQALCAANAQEALQILRRPDARVAVIVSDFRMPGQNGGDLLRRVAAEFPQVVRILVTAYADREMLLQTLNNGGVFRLLEKPLDPSRIREALAAALERYHEGAVRSQRFIAIDEALAFLAHELNTPLATISVFARSLENHVGRESEAGLDVEQTAKLMRNNAQYCLAVISSFWRSVHRSHSLRPQLEENREMTAHDLIETLLDSYPFLNEQREWITVERKADFIVDTQPNCVALVLSSLLSNALRAVALVEMPSITFSISVEPRKTVGIHDNGPGIAPQVIERLFSDPVTTYANAGGNGLGMILCNRVMQSFGGVIRICSPCGGGTTVTLDFTDSKNEMQRSGQ